MKCEPLAVGLRWRLKSFRHWERAGLLAEIADA